MKSKNCSCFVDSYLHSSTSCCGIERCKSVLYTIALLFNCFRNELKYLNVCYFSGLFIIHTHLFVANFMNIYFLVNCTRKFFLPLKGRVSTVLIISKYFGIKKYATIFKVKIYSSLVTLNVCLLLIMLKVSL